MIHLLRSLEPRLYEAGEIIFEVGEEVDEHIYVISRDPRKPTNSTGCYAMGFEYDREHKFFHVKLGPKTIICGYENIFHKKAEYCYKALMHVDAYGLRKTHLKPIFDEEKEFHNQMARYTLEYYHRVIRKPMLAFKKNILSQITKRQE